jgi:hypothetical protein
VPERTGVAFVEVWVEAFAFVLFEVEGASRSGTNLEVKVCPRRNRLLPAQHRISPRDAADQGWQPRPEPMISSKNCQLRTTASSVYTLIKVVFHAPLLRPNWSTQARHSHGTSFSPEFRHLTHAKGSQGPLPLVDCPCHFKMDKASRAEVVGPTFART